MTDLRAQTVTRPRNRLTVDALPGAWVYEAACGPDTAHLFVDREASERAGDLIYRLDAAAAICATCPVFALCEQAGRTEESGYWAVRSRAQKSARPVTRQVEWQRKRAAERHAALAARVSDDLARGLTLADVVRRESSTERSVLMRLRKAGRGDLADALAGITTTRRQQATGTAQKEE